MDGGAASRDLSLAVVGLGLIGGSFYKAARRAGYETFGLHHGESEGLGRADVVLVCLPPHAIVPWIREHAPLFKKGAVVIDICGVKTPICRDLAAMAKPGGWRFVGGHPMAGKEVTGFENSTPDLFVDKSMVLCPAADEPADDFAPTGLAALTAFFKSLGFSAGSFANMSRIATIDPEMWCELYLADRDALLGVLGDFIKRLQAFHAALDARDEAAIKSYIAAGAAAKREELTRQHRNNMV